MPESLFESAGLMRTRFSVVDWFLDPGRLSPEFQASFYWPSFLLLLLPLWLRHRRNRLVAFLALPALAYGTAVVVRSSGLINLRYFGPMLVPLTIVTCRFASDLLSERERLRGFVRLGVVLLLLVPLGVAVRALPVYIPWTNT